MDARVGDTHMFEIHEAMITVKPSQRVGSLLWTGVQASDAESEAEGVAGAIADSREGVRRMGSGRRQ